MKDYLNLNVTAKTRLGFLKRNAEKLNAGHNLRKAQGDTNPYTWRDVRYSGFHTAHASQGYLTACHDEKGKLKHHYSFTDQEYGREKDAHEILDLRHTGYFADTYQDNVISGFVTRLPNNRGFIPGYKESDNGGKVYMTPVIMDCENVAARYADSLAESMADEQREYHEKQQAADDLSDKLESKEYRLKECLALRNNPCFPKIRYEIMVLVENIRDMRETLKTDYVDVL